MTGLKSFFLLLCFPGSILFCQGQTDTLQKAETTRVPSVLPVPIKPKLSLPIRSDSTGKVLKGNVQNDSLERNPALPDSIHTDTLPSFQGQSNATFGWDTGSYKKWETHPFLPLHKTPLFRIINYQDPQSKDTLFYAMAGLVLLLAFIRFGFPKYFKNLFQIFFQTSLRQKQTRDQHLQENLASLFLNLLFFISGGLYIGLFVQARNWLPNSLWTLSLAGGAVLLVVYLFKFLFLLFAGWVFNMKEATNSYVFIVFMVNKIIGIILMPFLLVMAFSTPEIARIGLTISLGAIGILYGYRYLISFGMVQNKWKINPLHFFLYLCAVELLPLLLIYKVLINFIGGSF